MKIKKFLRATTKAGETKAQVSSAHEREKKAKSEPEQEVEFSIY
jgi:hypothetical protein